MARSRHGWKLLLVLTGLALAGPLLAEEPEREADEVILAGVVVDEAGRPVPGVPVEVWRGPPIRWHVVPYASSAPFDALFDTPPSFAADSPVRRRGRTDATGRFRLERLRLVDGFRARACPKPPLRGRVEILHEFRRPGHPLRLEVVSARTVKGRLVDDEGHGVRGWITATAHPGRDLWLGPAWYADFGIEDGLETDDDGRFTLAAPPGARVLIDAHLPGRCYLNNMAYLGREDGDVTLVVPSSGGASVTGRVRDSAGKPIAGARVVVHAASTSAGGYRPSHTGLTRTDAQGAFAVEHLPATDLAQVSVEAPGFAVWNRVPNLTSLVEGDPLELDVTLLRSARLRVHVVDEAGEGVPGARIWLLGQLRPNVGQPWERTVFSNAAGVAIVDELPVGASSLQVWAPGHYLPVAPLLRPLMNPLGRSLPALEAGSEREMEVVMKKGPTLHGTVVDAAGRGIPGAHLAFRLSRCDAPRGTGFYMLHETTDEQGRFALGGLPPLAHLTVEVTHADHPTTTTEIDPARPPGEAPLRIVLPEPARIAGRVVDAAGRPVADVRVLCEGTHEAVVSDAQGRFAFTRVAAGRRRLFLGYVSTPASTLYVDLAAGQGAPDVTLRHPGAGRGVLEGSLLEADGRPAGGLTVDVRSLAPPNASGHAYTDDDGRFRLERLPPGRYTVGPYGAATTVTIGEQGVTSVALTLPARPPSFVVEGVVVDAEGKPVDSASVRIGYVGDGRHTARGQTAVMSGRFRTRVSGEPCEIAVYVDNARDAAGRPLGVAPTRTVVADPLAEPVLVTLLPPRSMCGRVVGEDGRPIANLPLTLSRMDPGANPLRTYVPPLQAHTDDDGRFEFHGLSDHPYAVGLRHAAAFIPPGPIVVRPDDSELEIRLVRWQRLVTIVTAPDGSSVQGCRVEAYVLASGRGRGVLTALTDEGGRAEHPRLRPHDELSLRIVPPHPGEGLVADLCAAYKEGVSPGGAPVEVRLTVGAKLWGRVLDDAGQPIPGATVGLVMPMPEQAVHQLPGMQPLFPLRQNTRTDAQGTFLFRRLPRDQTVSLSISGPQDADPPYFRETLKGVVTGSEPVEVVLQCGVSIAGRIPDIDPSALAGLIVRAHPLLRGYPKATFRFDGTTTAFTLNQLRPGPYELHIHGGRNILYERVQTVEAPATQVVLRVTCVHDLAGAIMGTEGKTFRVELHVPGHEPFKSQVAADGLFRLQRLPDAKGTLVVYEKGSTRVALVEHVYPGRGDPLIVELIEGHPIRGRIVGQTKPLAKGRVIATRGSIRFAGTVTEEGVFQTPALPPGRYELAFEFRYPRDGFVPTPEAVEAGTTDLILEWARKP